MACICHREDEAEMLQKIFGDTSESEDSEPIRPANRHRKPGKTLGSDALTKPARKPPKDDVLAPHHKPGSPPLSPVGDITPLPLQLKVVSTSPVPPPPPVESPKRPMFKARSQEDEERLIQALREDAPSKEDIALLRLALGRMKGERAEMVGGVNWAYHPHDILPWFIDCM